MPLLNSQYKPPLLFRHGHFSTIYTGVFRKVKGLEQTRERLQLEDGDFLDLDWSKSKKPTTKVVLLFHGLEGNAQRHYIAGSAKILSENGFDACAVNFRSCSGEPNLVYRSYHSGATEDLKAVLAHVLQQDRYEKVFLMGYSLGGNLVLKYLGDGNTIPKEVKGGMGISVPCDLKDTCEQLLLPKNRLYANRFKRHLLEKLVEKQRRFPERISIKDIQKIQTLKDFDDVYTAPAHGFKDALDYYEKCSCKQFLPNITIPSLVLSAQNDSFLGEACYPIAIAEKAEKLYLELPRYGGHVGFWGNNTYSYAEQRAVTFFNSISSK